MTKVKKIVLWTAAVAVLAAGAWAIHRAADGRAVETGALPVAQVERRDIDVVAEAAGLVEPVHVVEVKSHASGL
ncbi:MAG TPA: efflux RND transporter periplasmic adaptor subunit, partial [Thermoanaerobaculia bacterium]|nr:efflux RND transporter periplasmic adaptor subunit [Thermoanaerobaculia bacterium]